MADPSKKDVPGWAVRLYGRRRYVPILLLCVLAAGYVAATSDSTWVRVAGAALGAWFAFDAWRFWNNPIPGSWVDRGH